MKKDLEESLRHMQTHPSTGLAHNQQVVSAQIETIFIIDSLIMEIKNLDATIEKANKQSEKLERTNLILQYAMVILTTIGTGIIVFPVIKLLAVGVSSYIQAFLISKVIFKGLSVDIVVTVISTIFAAITMLGTFFAEKKIITKHINFIDQVKFKDSLHMELRDKDGNVKETRDIK